MNPRSARRAFCQFSLFVLLAAGLALLPGFKDPSTLTPQEQLAAGWKEYRESEFDMAVSVFQSVQATQPRGSEAWLKALYGEASCWSQRRSSRDTGKATTLYQKLIKEAPDSPLAAWAALDIVRAQHLASADQNLNYAKLALDYAKVYGKYPDTLAGEDAFLYECRLSLSLADAERARKILANIEAFLQTHPKTGYLSPFYKLMAECRHRMGEQDKRLEYMIKALKSREIDPTTPFFELSTSYWDIAYAAEFEAGNFQIAREYYELLLQEFPNDDRAFAIDRALARMDAVEAAIREGNQPPQELLAAPSK